METITIDQIVDDLMFKITPDDKQLLKSPSTPTNLQEHWVRSSLQRWIRNHYHLWHTHPLTERWRTEGPNDMRDGVDYSTDHPDNMSSQIVDVLVSRLRK